MVDESSVRYIIENNVPVPVLEEDAQYKVLIDRVSAGTPIENFEDTKFSKYLERAKKENPEIFFLKN